MTVAFIANLIQSRGMNQTMFCRASEHNDQLTLRGDERQDTYPDPNDTDPSTRDGPDVGEAPVTVGGDDGRDELGNAEGNDEGGGRSLHEEESVRTRDEDQRLGDDSDLEVDNHVELWVVVVRGHGSTTGERDTELVEEERRTDDDAHQRNTIRECQRSRT